MNYTETELKTAIESLKRRAIAARGLALEETDKTLQQHFENNAISYQRRIDELTTMLENMAQMLG